MPESAAKRLIVDFGLAPVVATEIEFYLPGAGKRFPSHEVVALIETKCLAAGLRLFKAEMERGPDQYEVSFLPSSDMITVVDETNQFKTLINETFDSYNVEANFAAKPFRDAPGSGLHIHVHLEDKNGRNVFFREKEAFSPQLLHTIGGLLKCMNASMPIFAPLPGSYDRFNYIVNTHLICPTQGNVPLTVSWGTNNRTAALRLPNKPNDDKHIEHRVAGSDANVSAAIAAVLKGIHYGLTHQCNPGPPIYGDASLPQYNLPKLALSLKEAKASKTECSSIHIEGVA